MNYHRVCPRDLFNESKLLKCLGKISLLILDNGIQGLNMNHENEKKGFTILQDENTGNIFVSNLHFFDNNGTPVYFHHPLNSKDNWPIVMTYKNQEYWPLKDRDGSWQCWEGLFL